MGQHDTFRRAGGSRGVDNSSEIRGSSSQRLRVELRVALLGPILHHFLHRYGVDRFQNVHCHQSFYRLASKTVHLLEQL
jgi:hypothetical protein